MKNHAVVIAGGGPTGLMLAAELALAEVDVAIVERRTNQDLAGLRALGLHARTIEILDQRGIADRFLSQGQTYPVVHFHVPLNIGDFPSRHPYVLGLVQNHVERILAEWVEELGVTMYREREVTGFTQDDSGVVVAISDGTAWGFRESATGVHAFGKADDGQMRVVLTEHELKSDSEPTLRDVSEALIDVYGTDFGVHSPTWLPRFTDMARQAATYRGKRVLLAGDAAHVHPPMGGQGLNIGMQDAVNLGWKLAQVVKAKLPEGLLDTYHAEHHPVAARALRNTMAQVALRRTDDRSKSLGTFVAEFLGMDEPRKQMAAEMSGLGVFYELGEGHPLLGRRMPTSTWSRPKVRYASLHGRIAFS